MKRLFQTVCILLAAGGVMGMLTALADQRALAQRRPDIKTAEPASAEKWQCIRVEQHIHPNDLEGYVKLFAQEGKWTLYVQPSGYFTAVVEPDTCG